jgi:hypothetical protein
LLNAAIHLHVVMLVSGAERPGNNSAPRAAPRRPSLLFLLPVAHHQDARWLVAIQYFFFNFLTSFEVVVLDGGYRFSVLLWPGKS